MNTIKNRIVLTETPRSIERRRRRAEQRRREMQALYEASARSGVIGAWRYAVAKENRRRKRRANAMIILKAALVFIVCMLVLIGAEMYLLS